MPQGRVQPLRDGRLRAGDAPGQLLPDGGDAARRRVEGRPIPPGEPAAALGRPAEGRLFHPVRPVTREQRHGELSLEAGRRHQGAERVPEGEPERPPRLDEGLSEGALAPKGVVGEHPLAEPMDGRDRRSLEVQPRFVEPLARRGVELPRGHLGPGVDARIGGVQVRHPPEERAHPRSHLPGRALGEGHHQHLFEGRATHHQVGDQVLEGEGLPRARGGFDDHRAGRRRPRSRGEDRVEHRRAGEAAHAHEASPASWK